MKRADPRPYNPDGRPYFEGFDPASVPSPCYVIDRAAVEWNLEILRDVADRSGATMLLALKAFAPPPLFPLFREYLDGACASGVYEARLAREEIAPALPPDAPSRPFHVHTFAPAYSGEDLDVLLEISDHLLFNSLEQWGRFRDRCLAAPRRLTFGLRVNPECSLGRVPLYDPCAPASRLGITAVELDRQRAAMRRAESSSSAFSDPLDGITEIHFHTLCEDDSRALERTLQALENGFSTVLADPRITCLNMGGGHHITKRDYDRDHLVKLVRDARERFGLEVVLEPGEAAAIHTGILVASVLDLARNGADLAILDTSATAHMPDTLEMPYRPDVWGALEPGSEGFTYRLGGQTCLAGDVIGDYSFETPLQRGDRIVFDDMSHYTMVKTTTFNGIPLPSLALWDSRTGTLRIERRPAYEDFRSRLG
ncbi:MAG: carboxynorspermidine decarboxylase [Spirochaetaceae bacterium]|nr:MAG: carboxynorspermidine decarboxylase [Spirochaetaceae bacterium]